MNITNENNAIAEFQRLMAIPEVHGVYVQLMKKGYEIIVGAKRDRTFGTVVMIGVGGVTAELVKSLVSFVHPFSKSEMNEKLIGIPVSRMLYGFRGASPVSQDELYHLLSSIGQLMTIDPRIRELDLNPVLIDEGKLHIVDGRIIREI
jgi:acetyltransferase